ncbi:MAG TPA: NAD(P)-binding domain-containing protein [Alphaproteobacteria bacterium]|jgi:thioredoxin reductase|nr:NAD(P)-binding domain-containing protein [Alphaproteobacteria bacterium]
MKCDVAIVGAGPYGLSIAAHLSAQNISFRIFGPAMDTWRNAMPAGMFLKSEGFASSLSDPGKTFTLAHYSTANGIAYADTGLPVSLEVFTSYGDAFRQRFAPHHDSRMVSRIERDEDGFWLTLNDGEMVSASRVVAAIGITHYTHIPPEFAGLPEAFVSHASHHTDLSKFAGKKVVVAGAGASAMDTAAILVDNGATVELVARNRKIHFHNPPTGKPRTLWENLKAPMSGLGPGWRSRLCTDAPQVFRALPETLRLKIVDKHLGAAPGWWTRKSVDGKVPFHLNATLRGALPKGDKVIMQFDDADGTPKQIECDHIIAATGYVVDLRRLPFMTAPLLSDIKVSADHSPVLSSNFETTVPGFYFVGVSAAATFGPMMRFAFGAAYTAGRVSRDLVRKLRTRPLPLAGSAPERSAPSRA